jgi:hypothetical protein
LLLLPQGYFPGHQMIVPRQGSPRQPQRSPAPGTLTGRRGPLGQSIN